MDGSFPSHGSRLVCSGIASRLRRSALEAKVVCFMELLKEKRAH